MGKYPYFPSREEKARIGAEIRKKTQLPVEQYLIYDVIPCPHTQLNGEPIKQNEIKICPDCDVKIEFAIINGITIGRTKK